MRLQRKGAGAELALEVGARLRAGRLVAGFDQVNIVAGDAEPFAQLGLAPGAKLGISFSLRTMNQTGTLHTTPGYDDVTGFGTPLRSIFNILDRTLRPST